MKAILVKVSTSGEKVCSTSNEAIQFLESKNLFVNDKTREYVSNYFNGNNDVTSFAAGNNSGNPLISFSDVSDMASITEMSPANITAAVNEVLVELQKKQKDFKLTVTSYTIEGGFKWYYVERDRRHYPITEFWAKFTEFKSISELKNYILEHGMYLINKYGGEN